MEDSAENVDTIEEITMTAGASLKPRAAEAFRQLWASLFYSGRMTGKSVLVCSAGRHEGASTIASGLALAGGEPGGVARVALVDLNFRNPSLHGLLGLAQSPGIGEILLNGTSIEEAAKTVNENLDVYTVGNVESRVLGILKNDKLAKFVSQLENTYDNIVIDVAAVNHFPDAQVLAGVVKNTVLVAHTEQTPREVVAEAKKRIEASGGALVGLVLNLRSYPIPRFLYRRV